MNEEDLGIHILYNKKWNEGWKVLDKVWLYWHWRIPWLGGVIGIRLEHTLMYDISVMKIHFEDDFGELVYLSWVHGDKQEANGDRYVMA